jgi:hypothetical protein
MLNALMVTTILMSLLMMAALVEENAFAFFLFLLFTGIGVILVQHKIKTSQQQPEEDELLD